MSVHHRVLLIEDNDVDAAVFARCVEAMPGWVVERVGSLEAAEDLVEKRGSAIFDLVAVDLTLPDALDLEAIAFARRMLPQSAVVAVTARAPEEVDERALRAGAADLLVKGQMNARGVQRAVTHAVERNTLVRRQLESERNLRSVLAAWSDGLFVVGPDAVVLFQNDVAVALADGLVHRDGPRARLSLSIQPGEVVRTEVPRSGGNPVPVELTSWRIRWDDVPAQVVSVRDRRAEAAAEGARRLAELGSGALRGVHDIGNRVTAMLSAIDEARELLAASPITTLAPVLDRLAHSAEHIASVVRRAREGASEVRHSRVPVDLGALARTACEVMRTDLATVASLRLQVEPAAEVLADPVELTRVLDNLLRNAVEAVGPGQPERNEIRVGVRQEGTEVVVEVADSGPGIPIALQSRIFEQGVTTKPTGTGLGLSSVQAIVSHHGGTLEVESTPGQGASFRVRLPARHAPATRHRVLLLEDNPEVARANQRLLGQRYDIVVVGDGGAALHRIDSDDAFAAILCDLDMPGMDGRTFFERLSVERPKLAERVIFCSGGATTVELDTFLRTSGRPRLVKPIALGEAIAAIASAAEPH